VNSWDEFASFRLAQSDSVSKIKTVSQKLQKGTKLHYLYPSSFTFLMFVLQLLRTWRVVEEQPTSQPASRPPFPAFNFHHFTRSFERNISSALFC
jgi:hypothetical protein